MVSGIGDLHIRYLGDTKVCHPEEALTFGRDADLLIDDNPYLHRVAGRFRCTDEGWIVENTGSRIVLTLRARDAVAASTIPPRQIAAIVDREWTVSFRAGRTTYEISGSLLEPAATEDTDHVGHGTTQRFGVVSLTSDQRLAVVAMAQHFLRGELMPIVPSNKEIAAQLDWTSKAVQRKVDNLAEKLTQAGVPGLKGSEGASAERRRERIVDHMIRQHLIGVDDLELLDET